MFGLLEMVLLGGIYGDVVLLKEMCYYGEVGFLGFIYMFIFD